MLSTWVSGTCGSSEQNQRAPKSPGARPPFEETVHALWQNCQSGRAYFANVARHVKGQAQDTVCSWNTNGIMFSHGCSGHRMLLKHERNYALGWSSPQPFSSAKPAGRAPHGSNAFPLRTNPGASPAAHNSCCDRMQGPCCCVPPKTYMHTYIYIYIHIHTYIHTYVRTYIHTYIHYLTLPYVTLRYVTLH